MHAFNYHKATSVADAAAKFAASDEARLLAGGQTLIAAMKMRLSAPADVIDRGGIAELRGTTVTAVGISIAAGAVYFSALGMVWARLTAGSGRADWRSQRNFLIGSVGSTITMSILMGSDILLVEHFFSAREGGQFSSVTVTRA